MDRHAYVLRGLLSSLEYHLNTFPLFFFFFQLLVFQASVVGGHVLGSFLHPRSGDLSEWY